MVGKNINQEFRMEFIDETISYLMEEINDE